VVQVFLKLRYPSDRNISQNSYLIRSSFHVFSTGQKLGGSPDGRVNQRRQSFLCVCVTYGAPRGPDLRTLERAPGRVYND
jgi:hypothetical protein